MLFPLTTMNPNLQVFGGLLLSAALRDTRGVKKLLD
jgi:hypothetical protein